MRAEVCPLLPGIILTGIVSRLHEIPMIGHDSLFAEGWRQVGGDATREDFTTVAGHGDHVFDADAELARDIDPGFDREAHAGAEQGLVALGEIGGFVDIHADAVTEAVYEEVSQSTLFDDVPRRCVD